MNKYTEKQIRKGIGIYTNGQRTTIFILPTGEYLTCGDMEKITGPEKELWGYGWNVGGKIKINRV